MKKITTILLAICLCSSAGASELNFQFGSPSADKVIADAKATAIAKFKANLEARFYTALAKQITDNVFGTDGLQQDSGTFTSPLGGEVITWTTTSTGTNDTVTVVITESDGTVTTFTMPKEDNS